MIAATVAGIPDILGDKSCMAIRVAELARAGLTPDWTPGAAPHCNHPAWAAGGRSQVAGLEALGLLGRGAQFCAS